MERAVAVVKPIDIAAELGVLGALSAAAMDKSETLTIVPPRGGSVTSLPKGVSRKDCPEATDCASAAGMSSRIAANKGAQ